MKQSTHGEDGAATVARLTADEKARLRLAAIVESSDDAIIGKDLHGIITDWNAAATRIFGYQAEEIIGKSVLTLIPRELHHEEPTILEKLVAGKRIDHYETRRLRKDGTLVDVSLTISPIKDSHGNVIGASKTARDISDRKRAEAAIIQTEKLAALGRMAAAIAHEVNNPLEAITNLAYLLTRHPSLDQEASGYARMLLDEVGRISQVTKQTLGFYRDTNRPSNVNVAEMLDSILELHRPGLVKKNIQVCRMFVDREATVWGYAAELRQVFANLILNAIDALGQNGELTLRVGAYGGDNENVRIAIADNGAGIPREVRDRIFEPFFTTKQGSGNGLGLWVSENIVRKHGGEIRVHSSVKPGHSGAVFTVVLPAGQRSRKSPEAA